MSAPSVAELIRDHGRALTKLCSQCGRKSLYLIYPASSMAFVACLLCDTNADSRKSANLQEAV